MALHSSSPDGPDEFGAVVAALRAWRPLVPPSEAPRAAVAAILRQGTGGPELLFIKRAVREGDPWSGDIAFPGGKRELADPSLLATAVRETAEEVGLTLTPGSLVARFEDVVGRSNGFPVACFIFALDPAHAHADTQIGGALTPNAEVAAIIWTPLSVLEAPGPGDLVTVERGGLSFRVPYIQLGDHVLWGMTHRLVRSLLAAATLPRLSP